MNQLDFSPISEKDQQSVDTFSFLNNPVHSHRSRPSQLMARGCAKLFDRLCRMTHNRESYTFQLLKQFILFSSDEETIQIHYRYTQYQLEQGTEHLENSYGMRLKLTLGKTFEDIRNFSKKKKVYENPVYIEKLVSVYDKILQLNTQESYRSVIKIMAKFIEKRLINRNGQIRESEAKPTIDLIDTLEKHVCREQPSNKRKIRIQPEQKQRKYGKEDLLKTAKFSAQYQPKDRQTSHWKEQVENVDSYEEQPENGNPRIIIKSMSNQIYSNPYSTELMGSTSNKKFARSSRDNKCMSISGTPSQYGQNQDVFQTKRKQSSVSMSRNSEDTRVVQNVIIIRGHKNQRREPDRYIRVPVVSDNIKIVEMIPQSTKKSHRSKNIHVQGLARNLETISSHHTGRGSLRQEIKANKIKAYHKKQSETERQRQRDSQIREKSKVYQDQDTHECLGCKYCHFIKDMQNYRLQRTSRPKDKLPHALI